jgi:AAA15 family ATPase/GTPase
MAKGKQEKKPSRVESEEEEDKDDLEFDKLSKKDIIKIKKLIERIEEQELQLKQQEEYLIDKIEELKALHEEHEKLKHSHTSLIGKHENLEKKYACATNISSCVDPLEKENANLKTQLEVLASKHMKLQKDHEGKTRLSRRQRRHLRTITCFGCKKEDHKIQACPNSQTKPHCSGKTDQTSIHNRSD